MCFIDVPVVANSPSKEGIFCGEKHVSLPKRMGSLKASDFTWYSKEYDGINIVFSYGEFPNIPLIGTRGHINVNLVLSLRQLGYPIQGPPEERLLEAFLLCDLWVRGPVLSKRIKKGWETIVKK